MPRLPADVEVHIEIPRFGFVKREAGGRVDFVSPIPCPFNYGCVPGDVAPDGDPPDAIVLGRRLPRNTRVRVPVVGVVRFTEGDLQDDKLICSFRPPTAADLRSIGAFFALYARVKTAAARVVGGGPTPTRFLGVEIGR